jgi:uncharacterized protein (TIGR02284 family)
MDNDSAVNTVEKLIETCRDGQKGYQDAAEHTKRPDLKTFFTEQSSERGRFAGELENSLSKLGKPEKKESGSVAAALHRAWIDTKVTLGGGDKAILDSVEAGEDEAKEAYAKALSSSLPPEVAAIVTRQAQSIKAGHDRARSLRDGLAA